MADRPPLRARLSHLGLVPYGAYTLSKMQDFSIGQVFRLVPMKGRDPASLAAYWAGLNRAVRDGPSGAWPTAEHLHNDLKLDLGYTERYQNALTGEVVYRPQSVAMDKMSEPDFRRFFTAVQQRLIGVLGFDPWSRDDTLTHPEDG